MRVSAKSWAALAATVSALALSGCGGGARTGHVLPPADLAAAGSGGEQVSENYIIGPSDELTLFVWRNQELTTTVPVRPGWSGVPALR